MNLTLHLTDNCNMDCSYCIREKCPRDMTEDVLLAACDLAFSRGQRAGLCFFGGEPLLKKDLIYKALDYCEEKSGQTGIRFDCKMTTNGSLLDEEFLKRAVRAKMGIGLSFDGKAQDICRIFAGGKPTSSVVEEKAKLLLSYMPEASALATIAPQAVPYYAESVKYLHELGFKHLSFVIGPIYSKISECIKDKNPAERCHLGVRQMPVTPKGDLYPCTSFIGDEDYLLGNVFDGINEAKVIEIAKRSSTP